MTSIKKTGDDSTQPPSDFSGDSLYKRLGFQKEEDKFRLGNLVISPQGYSAKKGLQIYVETTDQMQELLNLLTAELGPIKNKRESELFTHFEKLLICVPIHSKNAEVKKDVLGRLISGHSLNKRLGTSYEMHCRYEWSYGTETFKLVRRDSVKVRRLI